MQVPSNQFINRLSICKYAQAYSNGRIMCAYIYII